MKVFKYSSIAIVLVVPLFFMMGCAGASWSFSDMLPGNGPKTVGADVKMEDITEFYFTYDSSTNPPLFQRYRFSVKDGAYQFYHEKREGNHWPLREKDITVSGTKELSPEEWKTFFVNQTSLDKFIKCHIKLININDDFLPIIIVSCFGNQKII